MIELLFPAVTPRAFDFGRCCCFGVLTTLMFGLCTGALAQTTSPAVAPPANQTDGKAILSGVLGEVTAIDAASRKLTLKLDSGRTLQVLLDEKALFRRVAPGEQSLTKAAKITLADIGAGDRVYVQGKVAPDQNSLQTRQVIVMSKETIAAKRERDSADWRQRGIVGVIVATNPEKKEITLRRANEAPETITLAADKTVFHRYASDSAQFSDARTSTFEELKVGDVLRARGQKSADGTRFTTEELVSGSFQTVGGTVTTINPEAGEVKINDLLTRKPLTIVVNKNSVLRRMNPEDALQFAPKKSGRSGSSPTDARAGRSADFQEVLERQPVLAVADLKAGDMILISSSKGSDPLRLTAITLVAGMDAVLKQFQVPAPSSVGPGANTGLPMGIPLP